ncbi:RHS repeat-associated core domain-containing protein [Aliikangiella sp. IMCC44359]|uniref:RHS repeat-associated core domain-containing protein n=1 Tax=Aliikangiella sp. IMCC44359 TaxID=3459125 RepID=UPI00403AB11E
MKRLHHFLFTLLLIYPLVSFSETSDDLISPSVEKKIRFLRDGTHTYFDLSFNQMVEHVCQYHLKPRINNPANFDGCDEPFIESQNDNRTSYSMRYYHYDGDTRHDGISRNAILQYHDTITYCPKTHPIVIDLNRDGKIDRCTRQKQCKAPNQANKVPGQEGNPIQCASGEKTQSELIYQGNGSDPLNYTTHYASPTYEKATNSLGQYVESHQGRQRGDNQLRQLKVIHNGSEGKIFRLVYKNGFSHLFYGSDNGGSVSFQSTSESNGVLTRLADGSFEQTSPSGRVDKYNTNGQLTARIYPNGNERHYTYTTFGKIKTISNRYNQKLEYFYNASHLLEKLVTPDNQAYHFEYDTHQNMTKIIYPDETPNDLTNNPSIQFLFENATFPNHLTGKINERGVRLATWHYDDKGRAISSEHAVGIEKVELDYSVENQTQVKRHVNDTLKRDLVYHYQTTTVNDAQTQQLVQLEQLTCTDCVVGSWFYEYDSNGYVKKSTSPKGIITTYEYNGSLELKRTEAVGTAEERIITTDWYVDIRKPKTVTVDNLKTDYVYNTNHQLESMTQTDLTTNETRTVTYSYNSEGLVNAIDGPRSDVNDSTSFTYYTNGNLETITNALGQVTTFSDYDANGRVGKIIDANLVETTLTYTPRGWLKTITRNGATTQYDYYPTGSLEKITAPNGQVIRYEYDNGERLVAIVDSQNNRMEYVRDLAGNVTDTKIKDASGVLRYTQTAIFNAMNQLTQSLGNNNQSNQLSYDADGNPTSNQNALNQNTTTSFDGINRVKQVVDANLGETDFTYNQQDQLTSVKDAEGKTTHYQYNAFGDLVELTSPDTGKTTFTYDKAGNVLTQTDARGLTTTFTYDALNRVLTRSYAETAENVVYTYDDTANGNKGIGHLTHVTEQSGSTRYVYNGFGQVTEETRIIKGKTYTTAYHYDANGVLNNITYPSGRSIQYLYDAGGQIESINSTFNGVSKILTNNTSYLPFGPLKSFDYGNGISHTNTFDLDYRLTDSTNSLQTKGYQYSLVDNISNITNSLTNDNQSFTYDPLQRLKTANQTSDAFEYDYDKVGNRTKEVRNANTQNYAYFNASKLTGIFEGSQTPTPASPISFWKLDDASGSSAQDSEANANHGTYYRGYTLQQEGQNPTSKSIKLNGSANTYVGLGNPTEFQLNTGTVEAWIKTQDAGSEYRGIIVKHYAYALFLRNNELVIYDWSLSQRTETGVTLNDNQWHHIIMSFDSGVTDGTKVYVDGQLVLTTTWSVSNQNHQIVLGAGNKSGQYQNFNGYIDDVKIYNEVLTPEQISTSYSSQFSYDANGNTTQKGNQVFTYNHANRLSTVANGSTSASYKYNAKGERSVKLVNGVETHAIYNLAGQLIAEADNQGNIIKEYAYFNSQPLAQMVNGEVYYYHNSHLGTPEVMTDESQTIVWQASYTPFGQATITTNTIDNNIRFPGQYFDSESGLHYNYFRYYDAEIGRYITSDPIGLAGGINTFGYGYQNPIMNFDPLGLYVPPALPQSVVDFSAGLGDGIVDAMSWGYLDAQQIRDQLGISGGLDKCSNNYSVGNLTGFASAAMIGPLARVGYITQARAIPKIAQTARQAVSMRNMVKWRHRQPFSRFMGTWHMSTYMSLVAKGKSATEIIAGAGRTNNLWSAGIIGVGSSIAGLRTTIQANDTECGCNK